MDCELPLDTSCCDGWGDYSPEVQAYASEAAWATLRSLTAGRVGNCPITVRPCKKGCGGFPTWMTYPVPTSSAPTPGSWINPAVVDGRWMNVACGCGRDGCSCTTLCEFVFPGEVAAVDEVQQDGLVLDPSAYRLDNHRRLVRTDAACWPLCQDMKAPLTADNTLGISYTPGVSPGVLGRRAAGLLACEYGKACTGGDCALPANVTSVNRLGVSITLDPAMFPAGQVGIPEVDSYVRSLNPHGFMSPTVVWSPSTLYGRTTGV